MNDQLYAFMYVYAVITVYSNCKPQRKHAKCELNVETIIFTVDWKLCMYVYYRI